MPDYMKDIIQFHEKFELTYQGAPRSLGSVKKGGHTLFDFRNKFMREEHMEYGDAQRYIDAHLIANNEEGLKEGLALQLDALVDLTYVVLGTAYLQFGSEVFNQAWKRVHEANMKKVRATSSDQSKRGSTFDVVKPRGWVAPDLGDLVANHAHRESDTHEG